MNLQENIRKVLMEEISAKEAYDEYNSVKTIVDGKRDIAFTTLNDLSTRALVFMNRLQKIKVPPYNYIVYRKGSEELVKELLSILNKYGGSLSYLASEEDNRRIGQILNYHESEIEDYIKHNKDIKKNLNIDESVVKPINEETNLPHYIRRRIGDLENLIYDHMSTTYRPERICRYRNGDMLLEHLTVGVIEDMYYTYFEEHISYETPEWEQAYKAMETYIKDKFGDKVKQYYHIHCGD